MLLITKYSSLVPTAHCCESRTNQGRQVRFCGEEPRACFRYQNDLACGELSWQSRFPMRDARDGKHASGEQSFWAVTCWGLGVSCRELCSGPCCPNSPPQAATVGNGPCCYPMTLHMGCERKLLARWFCWWTAEKGPEFEWKV